MQYHYSLHNQMQLSEEAHILTLPQHMHQCDWVVEFILRFLKKYTSGFHSNQSLHKQVYHKWFSFFDTSMCDWSLPVVVPAALLHPTHTNTASEIHAPASPFSLSKFPHNIPHR